MSEKNSNPVVVLENVRLSYPHLFKPRIDKEEPNKPAKFEATAILDKKANAKDIAKVRAAIEICKKSPVMKGKAPRTTCLRAGDDTPDRAEADGYGPNVFTVGARNKTRPAVIDRRKNPISEEDLIVYPGCYVNMSVEIYPFFHPKNGFMVCASLRAVQFVRKGQPLGEGTVDVDKEFSDLGDEDGSESNSNGSVDDDDSAV